MHPHSPCKNESTFPVLICFAAVCLSAGSTDQASRGQVAHVPRLVAFAVSKILHRRFILHGLIAVPMDEICDMLARSEPRTCDSRVAYDPGCSGSRRPKNADGVQNSAKWQARSLLELSCLETYLTDTYVAMAVSACGDSSKSELRSTGHAEMPEPRCRAPRAVGIASRAALRLEPCSLVRTYHDESWTAIWKAVHQDDLKL